MSKPILLLDFDGVCHSYTSGWQGAAVIPDLPVPGLFEFLTKAQESFDVQIYSARSGQDGGREAMHEWFRQHYAEWCRERDLDGDPPACELSFPESKPAGFLTIDDRAICFTGTWPEVSELLAFKPWNKRDV
jgi:hypothetical protein